MLCGVVFTGDRPRNISSHGPTLCQLVPHGVCGSCTLTQPLSKFSTGSVSRDSCSSFALPISLVFSYFFFLIPLQAIKTVQCWVLWAQLSGDLGVFCQEKADLHCSPFKESGSSFLGGSRFPPAPKQAWGRWEHVII